MSSTHERQFTLTLPPSGIDSGEGYWERVANESITTWIGAERTLRRRSIAIDRTKIEIEFDWSPISRSWKKYKDAMSHIQTAKKSGHIPERLEDLYKFQRRDTRVPIAVRNRGECNIHYPSQFLESAIADAFLIVNLACPGACNFYRSSLTAILSPVGRVRSDTVSWSHIGFEIAKQDGLHHKIFTIDTIDLDRVNSWFWKVRSGVRQLPQNNLEKVLFAILRMSQDELSPVSIVWLFFAIETLLATKPGENRSAIERRTRMLLGLDGSDAGRLKTELRNLYEYRSSVVHGGLKVPHPLSGGVLDDEADREFDRLLNLFQFGFSLLIACLQKVVINGWTELEFREQIIGADTLRSEAGRAIQGK